MADECVFGGELSGVKLKYFCHFCVVLCHFYFKSGKFLSLFATFVSFLKIKVAKIMKNKVSKSGIFEEKTGIFEHFFVIFTIFREKICFLCRFVIFF